MKLHLSTCALFCLAHLSTCFGAVIPDVGALAPGIPGDLHTHITHVADQLAHTHFSQIVSAAARFFGSHAGTLHPARPWPRNAAQLLATFDAHLAQPNARYVVLGKYHEWCLFGVPWPVHWNGEALASQHVFIFGIERDTGEWRPLGFTDFRSGGVASDTRAFAEEAARGARTATYADIRERLGLSG